MLIKFVKMTGAGNDFILIDNRNEEYSAVNWTILAPVICHRHFGVGADGLLILGNSDKADFSLGYYNSDGSYGGMCGNGGRCAAYFFMVDQSIKQCKFESLDYVYSCKRIDNVNISIKMKPVSINNIYDSIDLSNMKIPVYIIDTGSPHAVIFIEDLPDGIKNNLYNRGISELGKIIRNHARFKPIGTNVDFIAVLSDKSVSMRTYERGVESETLACGTGAIATACVVSLTKNIKPPLTIHTKSNKVLSVGFIAEETVIRDIELIGPAERVFTGSYEYLE